MYTKDKSKWLYGLIHEFLRDMVAGTSECAGNQDKAEAIIAQYQTPKYELGQLSLPEIYHHFCGHAQNKAWGGNGIRAKLGFSWNKEDTGELSELLFGYDPSRVKKAYPTLAKLREKIEAVFGYKRDESPNKQVTKYVETLFELAHYFAKFDNGQAVYDKFWTYYGQQFGNLSTPDTLCDELEGIKNPKTGRDSFFGMSYALINDALKEMGYIDCVKVDSHIENLAPRLGISEDTKDKRLIAKAMRDFAYMVGITPYHLDKYLYLIGSGNFNLDGHGTIGEEIRKQKTVSHRRNSFVKFVREKEPRLERIG